jgi:hypothetical protein
LHREQQDHQDAEPEVRRRQSPKREDIGRIVPCRAAADGRDHARGNADHQRDRESYQREFDGDRKLLQYQAGDRLLAAHRFAQVAMQYAADPVSIAHRQRLVEMQFGAQIGDDGRILLLARKDLCRIAGQQLLQPEDQHRDEHQRRQQRREPFDEVLDHGDFLIGGSGQPPNFKPDTRSRPSGTLRTPVSFGL